MKKKLKSKILVSALLLALSSGAIFTPDAHAIVGLILGNAPVALAGVALLGGGLGFTAYMDNGGSLPPGTTDDEEFNIIMGVLVADIAGVTMLNGKDSQSLNFSAVDQASGKRLGMTDAELAAYNNELDTINLILQEVEVQAPKNAADAKSIWLQHQNELSPGAFSGMSKVAAGAFKRN